MSKRSQEQKNQGALDRYSVAHFLFGLWMGQHLPPGHVAIYSVLFEIVEDRIKDRLPGMFPAPSHDSKLNALSDVGVVTLGAILSNAMRGIPDGRMLGS